MIATFEDMDQLKVLKDVITRWWSTYSMVERLLYLKPAIQLHERMDSIPPLLTDSDWKILALILPVLEPFTETQKLLEEQKYVTGCLVIAYIYDLRSELDSAPDYLKESLADWKMNDDA